MSALELALRRSLASLQRGDRKGKLAITAEDQSMKTTDKALLAAYRRAEEFIDDPKLLAAFKAASLEPKLRENALDDPRGYLETKGVKIPKGLELKFISKMPPTRPGPDFEFFTIRLFKCRTFWVKKRNAPGFEKVVICFGIEITPNKIPGGPIG